MGVDTFTADSLTDFFSESFLCFWLQEWYLQQNIFFYNEVLFCASEWAAHTQGSLQRREGCRIFV